ncbi:hypothetical protein MBLNU230_g1931t1 [Neophaeotheca triangularis]
MSKRKTSDDHLDLPASKKGRLTSSDNTFAAEALKRYQAVSARQAFSSRQATLRASFDGETADDPGEDSEDLEVTAAVDPTAEAFDFLSGQAGQTLSAIRHLKDTIDAQARQIEAANLELQEREERIINLSLQAVLQRDEHIETQKQKDEEIEKFWIRAAQAEDDADCQRGQKEKLLAKFDLIEKSYFRHLGLDKGEIGTKIIFGIKQLEMERKMLQDDRDVLKERLAASTLAAQKTLDAIKGMTGTRSLEDETN